MWHFILPLLVKNAGDAIVSKLKKLTRVNGEVKKLRDKVKKAESLCNENLISKNHESEKLIEGNILKLGDYEFEDSLLTEEVLKSRNWDTSNDNIGRFSQIISALPLAGVTAKLSGENYMIVESFGPLARAKDKVGFLAIIKGADGKIKGHAKLHPSQLGKALNPALLWTAASFIVAQKHLHDISDKLEKMSFEVKKISDFQQNDRLSGLVGDYEYLIDFVERVKISPEKMEGNSDVIEDIYRKSFSAKYHLIKDVKKIVINPEDLEFSVNKINEINKLVIQIFLCIKIRIYCFMLLEIISPNSSNIASRLDKIRDEIIEIPQLVYNKFEPFFERELYAIHNLENVRKLKNIIELFCDNFEETFSDFSMYYNDFSRNSHSISSQRQKILLKMDEQRIVGISDI